MIQLGYYGKIPHRGDFVRYNLPQAFITVWDDWLQSVLQHGESSHADHWPEYYARAPRYRFALSPDLAGANAWLGIVQSSQDKVGRRFPFCLCAGVPAESTRLTAAFEQHHAWFTVLDRLLDDVLQQDGAFESLQERLAALEPPDLSAIPTDSTTTAAPSTASAQHGNDLPAFQLGAAGALGSRDGLQRLLDAMLMQTLGQYSLWSGHTAAGRGHTLVAPALPDGPLGVALFDQRWQDGHWLMLGDALDTDGAAFAPADSGPIATPLVGAPLDEGHDALHDTVHAATPRPSDVARSPGGQIDNDAAAHAPSEDDWAAFENFDTARADVKPEVEPLELDEDATDKAPWEH